MSWGTIEIEPEVDAWLDSLPARSFGRVERYIDLLAERGVDLGEPHSRQLWGKLRELRFELDHRAIRISYFIRPGRRIVLLTVFQKTRRRERLQVARAVRAMSRCIAEEHDAEGDRG